MKHITAYLHSNKETMYDLGKKAGLEGQALEYFMYALYEVRVDLMVDEDTGDATIHRVDDMELNFR